MSTVDESWRLFIAIELPVTVRRALTNHIDHLRQAVPDARASWTREENLHLTLKFLGDTHLAKVEHLSRAAQRASNATGSFGMLIEKCGAFPPHSQPRVFWIGIEDPSGRLGLLHQLLEDECAAEGFDRERRPFHPHLTIARLRTPQDGRRLAPVHKEMRFDRETVAVSHLALIRSELGGESARHTVIARHPFLQELPVAK
jgi:2'-5' RNA ligase